MTSRDQPFPITTVVTNQAQELPKNVPVNVSTNGHNAFPEKQQAEWEMENNPFYSWSQMTRTVAHYERLLQIGEGTYGKVFKAKDKVTSRIVAMKKIRIHSNGHQGYGLPATVIREIKILKQLHHPNMVEMIEVVSSKGVEHLDDDDNSENDEKSRKKRKHDGKDKHKEHDRVRDTRESIKGNLFLVLEFVSHDLTGLMDMAYRFNEVQVKCIFRQLLEVLAYIHKNKYVHRDLKCSNILIDSRFNVKLADFGLSRCLASSDERAGDERKADLTNKVITLWYRPPELLLGTKRYGASVDVWSAGCILAELVLGRPLFPGKTDMEQLNLIFDLIGTPTEESWEGYKDLKSSQKEERIIGQPRKSTLRQKYSDKMSTPALNLIEKLLELDPEKRTTAEQALSARYFITEPTAPTNPSDLGMIDLGYENDGNFHEFRTKKKRREAKIIAERASHQAKANGMSEKEAEEIYNTAYKEHIKKAATGIKQDVDQIVSSNVDSVSQSGKSSKDESSSKRRSEYVKLSREEYKNLSRKEQDIYRKKYKSDRGEKLRSRDKKERSGSVTKIKDRSIIEETDGKKSKDEYESKSKGVEKNTSIENEEPSQGKTERNDFSSEGQQDFSLSEKTKEKHGKENRRRSRSMSKSRSRSTSRSRSRSRSGSKKRLDRYKGDESQDSRRSRSSRDNHQDHYYSKRRSRDKSSERSSSRRHRDYDRERRYRDRDRDYDDSRDRDRGRSRETRNRDRDIENDSRDGDRSRSRGDRNRERDKEMNNRDEDRYDGASRRGRRDRDRSRDRERDRDRGKDRERSRDRPRDKDREKDRSRERDRSRDRSRDREKDRDRNRDRDRSRDRNRDRDRDGVFNSRGPRIGNRDGRNHSPPRWGDNENSWHMNDRNRERDMPPMGGDRNRGRANDSWYGPSRDRGPPPSDRRHNNFPRDMPPRGGQNPNLPPHHGRWNDHRGDDRGRGERRN